MTPRMSRESLIDITQRKQVNEKIRDQENELRQMLDLTPQQVAVFGADGERLYANRVALDYVGLSLEQWLQTPGGLFRPCGFIHPDDRERAVRAYSDLSGVSYELELRLQGADGSYRWFLVRFNSVRDEHGQIIRWYVASTDIEDRKRAEDEIKKQNIVLRDEIDKTSMFEEIVGVSAPLHSLLNYVSRVAPTDSTVLITGETGTGKELIARAIHKRSLRSARPFVSVNCAAIPIALIASELFGHEKGAFTGATQRRQGRFELAEGGTIFLDEVGELPAEVQIALLRVLQEREFERVGSARPIHTNVRVIAATNRDLQTAIDENEFRLDLFYRLNVFPVEVPPLRERPEDIAILMEYFIHRFAKRAGKKINRMSKKALKLAESYHWPGNVRELQNVVERAVIVSDSNELNIDERWLSGRRTKTQLDDSVNRRLAEPTLGMQERAKDREMIEAALIVSKGRVSGQFGAAARLGIPPSTLVSRMKALKIDKRTFKQE
jgi:PAS domain S-box-containing protein